MLMLGYHDHEEVCVANYEEARAESLPDPDLDCAG